MFSDMEIDIFIVCPLNRFYVYGVLIPVTDYSSDHPDKPIKIQF